MSASLSAILQERIGHALVWVATNTLQTSQKGHTFGEGRGPHLTHLPERQSMSAFNLRTCAAVIAPVLAISGALFAAAPAQAVSTNVVISEVYGGGGNSNAIWKNDFVELYNRSDADVDVSGWAVQYYSAAGTTATNTTTSDSRATAPAPENSTVSRKSVALLSVSTQGLFRVAEVVLLRPGAGLPSKVVAVPYPTRSTTVVVSARRRSMRPLPAAMAAVPITLGVGRGVARRLPPAAICTR